VKVGQGITNPQKLQL